jgi:hypothetical protein
MRVLIVGAGAVGQVYGHLLARGGAEVSVYVRPRREAEARAGYSVTRLSLLGRRTTSRFVPRAVYTSPASLRGARFDQAWICVPTDAVGELAEALAALGDTPLVNFVPGLDGVARLAKLAPGAIIAEGFIGLISWFAPLEGSDDPREAATPPGVAFLEPPPTPSGVGPSRRSVGSARVALAAVTALRAGGGHARFADDPEAGGAVSTSILLPLIGVLEAAGWRLAHLGEPEWAELAAQVVGEAATVAALRAGIAAPPVALALRPGLLALAARLAPLASPFDLETYLRVHFTKVGAQTRLLLGEMAKNAAEAGRPHAGLDELAARLDAARAAA